MKFRHMLAILAITAAAVACHKDPTGNGSGSKFTQDSQWSIIGTIGGADWNRDIAMKTDGTWHVAYNVTVTASDQFKFRFNKDWNTNFGLASGTTATPGAKTALSQDGGNIKTAAGTYDIYLAPETSIAYILKAGSEFTHASEGRAQKGADLAGDYSPSLAPASKKSGITYQLNVYSFADSDGDGWGDFQGIIDNLDYLDAIGATALWLSPVNASQSYHAYDITDYYSINPRYGGKNATAAQAEQKLKDLITAAKAKNIDIYIDYVLNHSGDKAEWFKKALAGDATYRDYYVFANASDETAVDNFAGQYYPGMGGWHQTDTYKGRLHFTVKKKGAKDMTVTVTKSTDAAQSPNKTDPKVWIFTNDNYGMYETSTNTFEITLDVNTNWGFLVRTSTTSWDNGTKWGGTGAKFEFGKEFQLAYDGGGDIVLGTGYFGSFAGSMPDLNYGPYSTCQNSAAFQDLAASADKWINLGVNGLRLDAVMWIYQCNTDANVKFLSEWYNHCNATYKARGGKGDLYMVGEAYDWNADVVAPYYKGLPSLFDFAYYGTVKDRINSGNGSNLASTIKSIQDKNRTAYNSRKYTHSSGFYDAIKLSNHDENRVASELGNNDQKKRLAGAILLTSPGKPFIYQGEELGYWGVKTSGDENVRQPIYWEKDGKVPTSWHSFDKSILAEGMSVSEQSADNRSLLQMYRHFAYARNTHSALAEGTIDPVNSGNNAVAAWKMVASSETVLVMHNLGGAEVTVTAAVTPDKVIVSSSNGEIKVSGTSVTLPAYSSVVFSVK